MASRVFYLECDSPFWVRVAQIMAAKHHWQPVYWAAWSKMERAVGEAFPEIVFHDSLDAARGICPKQGLEIPQTQLEPDLLDKLAKHEAISLKMMDRMDPLGTTFSYHQRVRLYHRLLAYWLGVLEHFKPDILVFPVLPHMIYDYIVYILGKTKKIETVMLSRSLIPGRYFVQKSFEDGPDQIIKAYKQASAENFTQERLSLTAAALFPASEEAKKDVLTAHMNHILSFYQDKPYSWQRFEKKLTKLLHPSEWLDYIRRSYKFWFDPAPLNYLVKPGQEPDRRQMSGLEWRWVRIKGNRKKTRLRKYYQRLTHKPDLEEPYLFVALHYQPEANTSPGAGLYVHQDLMVRLLAKAIPQGWRLYVKEHPAQFAPVRRGDYARHYTWYDDLASIPGVKLVPITYPPALLIENARAVATVSGTSGWEALIKGKPVLIFGHAAYEGCEGVFYTPTLETCRQAIQKIADGFQPDSHKIRLFAHITEQQTFKAFVDERSQHWAGIDDEENARNISQAVADIFS